MVAEALTSRGFSRDAVAELSAVKDEPAWLRHWRQRAWAAWEAIPMPTRQDEDWRRTDIRALDLDRYAPYTPPAADEPLPPELDALAVRDGGLAGLLVQQDAQAVRRDVDSDLAGRGVLVTDLDTAVREHGALVRPHLGTVVPADADKFAALNAALWSGGAFVHVPPGVDVALPVQALVWQQTPGAALFPRTLVVVERGARLTFIQTARSVDQADPALHNGIVELAVGDGAHLRYVSLQRWGGHVWSFSTERAALGRDARVEWVAVGLGGRVTKSYLQARLLAPGARAHLAGLVYAGGKQHFDYHTLQEHVAPRTSSDLLFKTALQEQARAVCVGLIQVRKTAPRSDAALANRTLLLSQKAKADAIPRLEIEANDVRCTHSATAAPVDPEQVFQLERSGLPRPEAVRMIVEGYFEPILGEIPAETVRERLRAALADKLAG